MEVPSRCFTDVDRLQPGSVPHSHLGSIWSGVVVPVTGDDNAVREVCVMQQFGLIAQQKQTVDQLSVIYALTEKGKNMLPVLRAIESFSKKFL